MRESFDAVVAGASIAGCALAIHLGRSGLRVALVERRTEPDAFKRICTHILQASANPAIERLGLGDPIEAAGGVRTELEMWTRWGWIRPPGGRGTGSRNLNIRRERLDPLLRRSAAGTPGVDLLPGRALTRLLGEEGRIAGVRVEGQNGEVADLGALLVVGADGRDSRVAALAGIERVASPNTRFAYFAYFRDLPLTSGHNSQSWTLEPDMAFAFPTDSNLTLLTLYGARERLPAFKADLDRSFRAAFANLPDGPDLTRGKRVSPLLGRLDMPNVARPPALPGLALVGDAALAADPAVGVGCGWALQSAEWLADAVADPLADGDPRRLDAGLRLYAERHDRELGAHMALIREGSLGRPFGSEERVLYGAATRDPVIAGRVLDYASRTIAPRELFGPRTMARAASARLRRRRRPAAA